MTLQQIRRLSDKGLTLIKSLTDFHPAAYADDGSRWLIGYGHAGTVDGRPVAPGMTVTVDQAEALLASDLLSAQMEIGDVVDRPLRQCEFDALVSFQISTQELRRSMLRHLLNSGASAVACANEFGRYVYTAMPDGSRRVSREKQQRRAVERDHFLGRR